jgi:type I restriction enzyme, S subunit
MSNKKKLIPNLRFSEFKDEGEWQIKKIGDIANSQSSSMALNKLDLKSTGYPVYGADSIVGYIDEFQHQEKYISVVKDGSGVGRLNLCQSNSSILGTLTSLKSKNKKQYDLNWLYYLLNTVDFSVYVKGAGIPHIYYSDFKNESVPVPTLKEQQKIASSLSSLDDLIEAHSEKLNLLKDHKKGLMQNLFPQEGEDIPKIRFTDFKFDVKWQIKELRELGSLINGLTYSPDDITDNGLLVLRSSNIQNGIIDLKDCVYVRMDVKGANHSKPNDILVCIRNGSKSLIGKNAIIPIEFPVATHGAFMSVFRAKNPEFVFQLFQTDFYDNQVKADLGATINSINGKNFLKYKFPVPQNPEEQRKIASCLTSVDGLIKSQTEKVELLKKLKLGLIQNLFPKISE